MTVANRHLPGATRGRREEGKIGFVYILSSSTCKFIKIGGTDYSPSKRIREINGSRGYKAYAPWSLHDCRQVRNWRAVESNLHYRFRGKRVRSVPEQKELFELAPISAAEALARIDDTLVLRKPKIDRMFQDEEFAAFLMRFFRYTGILNWLDIQGAWTFSLFPSTNGARYYTLNVGRHEVAFATVPSGAFEPLHMLHMDRLVRDFKNVTAWVKDRRGRLIDNNYASGLYRSTSVMFEGDFKAAEEFLDLPGVRRAIIGYWTEALIGLQERGSNSVHARHHNWNAVAEIKRRMIAAPLYRSFG